MASTSGKSSDWPNPGWSGAITSNPAPASRAWNGSQAPAPPAACRNSTGSPAPPRSRRTLPPASSRNSSVGATVCHCAASYRVGPLPHV